MERAIQIKSSSSGEIYTVLFNIDNDLTTINCSCKAGLMKSLCKHRLDLIAGDVSAIVNKSDIEVLSDILNTFLINKVSNLYTELNEVENEIKKLDLIRKKIRKDIGLKFSNGF